MDPLNAKGWGEASPLENYSSLHEISWRGLIGLDRLQKRFFAQFCFNLHAPLSIHPKSSLLFHVLNVEKPPEAPNRCYTTKPFNRWHVDLTPFRSFDELMQSRCRWSQMNFVKTEKIFREYGSSLSFIEGDWTPFVDEVYQLYANVAKRHAERIYDINFFKKAAKRPDYKLICTWQEGKMTAMNLLLEELPTLHCVCCGMDYSHSTKSYAYSWMGYELLRYAMENKKYKNVDVGSTADASKKMIGYEAYAVRMDIYSRSFIIRNVLKFASLFTTATLTSEGRLTLSWFT